MTYSTISVLLTASTLPLYGIALNKRIFLFPALCCHAAVLVLVSMRTGLAPFVNGYGSMVFFSLLIMFKTLIVTEEKIRKLHIIAGILLLTGSLFMPLRQNTVPAVLDSVWLVVHVPLFFFGYLSLTTAFIASFFPGTSALVYREMKYTVFFSWTGILTGAFWAEVSWGRFWGWDSKETAALSILLFALSYFHFTSERERRLAVVFAFVSMIVTYFVVSFLLPGNHNYL